MVKKNVLTLILRPVQCSLLAREVAACFAEKHGPDVARVARHLVHDRDFPAGPALKTAHSSTYDRNVRIKVRPQEECLARLRKVRDGYKATSEDCVRQGALGLFLSVHPPLNQLSRAAFFQSSLCRCCQFSCNLRSPYIQIVSCSFLFSRVLCVSILSCRIFVFLSIL